MGIIYDIIGYFTEMDIAGIILASEAVLMALITLFLLIPGDQPEKALQKALDFLAKFSKK